MAKRIGPAKVKQYSLEFKFKAVQLSDKPGVLMKDVAESLCIHPFMLSKWRKAVPGPDTDIWEWALLVLGAGAFGLGTYLKSRANK
ncbi:transposase [Ramlibacter sp. G-1-2-2]|uniref:Transposase n=1 Tax=Ramlibacter agri TaxID=2728837 RepID=A0A848H601_9BURK|nr:transposase [Ramlibacter agri]